MLNVYNKAHVKTGAITEYEELKIDTEIKDGVVDKTLSFSIYKDYANDLELEGYLRTKDDEYVIKQMDFTDDYYNVTAVLNIEEFESETFGFEHIEVKIDDVVKTIASGTEYTVTVVDTITKKRTIRQDTCTLLDLLKQVCKTYLVEMQFDTINKTLKVYNQLGTDKGEYFMDTVNAEKIENDSDTLEYCTKLICSGKVTSDEEGNDTTIRCIVTNNTYSDKVITKYWKDERYTILEDLQEDAQLKLDEMARPKVSYKVDIVKLGNVSIGDRITLINKATKTRLKTRVVKMEIYSMEQGKDTVEISSKMYSFEDMQKTYTDTSNTVDNITSDNGTISESALKQPLDKLIIQNAYINNLSALVAKIGTLDVGEAHITYLDAVSAKIQNLEVNSATIADLQVANARIGTLESGYGDIKILQSDVATINNLIAGNVSAGSTQTIVLNANNTTIANALIKSAMIESLDVNKINAGTISTNKFSISSDNGAINISDSTMQFKDSNGNVRIQLGQAADGTFNFLVRGEDGKTALLTPDGITENAVADGLIKTDMMADKSVKGKKIDWDDFFTTINADGTHTLNSSKVKLNSNNQTLDVAFNQLTTNVDSKLGRNIILNSCFKNGTNSWNLGVGIDTVASFYVQGDGTYVKVGCIKKESGTDYVVLESIPITKIEKNQYTLSFMVKADGSAKNIHIDVWNGNDDSKCFTTQYKTIDVEWQKVVITFTNSTNYTNQKLAIGLDSFGIVYLANVKLEKGNKATDYCEAIEDLQNTVKTNTTSISVQQGKIEQIVSELTQTTDKTNGLVTLTSNYNTVVDTVNSHTQTIGSVTSTEGDGTLWGSVKSNISSIAQLNNQISLKVDESYVKNEINNIGTGRNYCRKAWHIAADTTDRYTFNVGSDDWFDYVITLNVKSMEGYCVLVNDYSSLPFTKDKKYSVSFKAHTTDVSSIKVLFQKSYTENVVSQCNVNLNTDGKYYKYTCTFTAKESSAQPMKIVFNNIGTVVFTQFKVEEGEKVTDYTDAPEDVKAYTDTKISDKAAEIKITTDAISNRVSDTEKTLNADGTGLVSRMSSVEQNITASAITTKISQAINNGTSSINTTYFTQDNTGLTIKNGGIKVLNSLNTQIFGVDTDGQLSIRGKLEQFNSNGRKSVEIKNNALRIYNYKSTNDDLVGGFANINDFTNTSGYSGIALYGTQGHALSIGMKRDNTITKYITCVDNGDGDTDRRIDVQMETYFRGWGATFCNNDFTMRGFIKADAGAETGLCIIGANAVHLGYGSSSSNYAPGIDISSKGIVIWGNVTVAGTINGQRIGN